MGTSMADETAATTVDWSVETVDRRLADRKDVVRESFAVASMALPTAPM